MGGGFFGKRNLNTDLETGKYGGGKKKPGNICFFFFFIH